METWWNIWLIFNSEPVENSCWCTLFWTWNRQMVDLIFSDQWIKIINSVVFCCPAFPALLSKLLLDQTTSCQLTLIRHHLLPRPNVEHLCLVVFPLPVYWIVWTLPVYGAAVSPRPKRHSRKLLSQNLWVCSLCFSFTPSCGKGCSQQFSHLSCVNMTMQSVLLLLSWNWEQTICPSTQIYVQLNWL